MKIETKEKIENFFGWRIVAFLYLISFVLGFIGVVYNGAFDDVLSITYVSFLYSVPYFSIGLAIYGIVSMITMIVLKSGQKRIIFSIISIVLGVLAFIGWYVMMWNAFYSITVQPM